MCSVITHVCGYHNSTFILIGDVYCPNTKCLGKRCLHKKTSLISRQKRLSMPAVRVSVSGAQYSFWRSNKFLFLVAWPRGLHFEENPKSVQDVIGDVYCPGKYCSNREKCESLGGYVRSPRSNYACGKCGAWLFVHKDPFMLQEHVKTTKTDKIRLSLLEKDDLGTQQTTITYCPISINQKIERKNCVRTTKYERLSEMCIVQHVEMKSSFISQPIKRLVSTTVKIAKLAATFWIFFLKDQKPTIMLFGGDGAHFFARKTSRDYEKEKPSPFLKKFLRHS